ncbi:MAG TPA: sugar transferase [Candidatus Deferrimicrobium sp.]|nr:sugar transferase [Candidatus Deferrimicrobium sp.]
MSRWVKRWMDIAVAGTGLVILSPVLAAIAVAVLLDVGRPILFRQARPGLRAVPFDVVKFRTMRDIRDKQGRPLPIEDRITRIGGLLRRLSLDELPELWNVLKGEMSLVGPRPLLIEYLPIYTPEQARRHEVRPGVTGWAQVNGRHSLDWEDRFKLDVWYVDHWSLGLDLRILVATLKIVLSGEGAGMGKEPPANFKDQLSIGERDPR